MTGNQTDRGHTQLGTLGHWGLSVPHWGGVNCIDRGHIQAIRQGPTVALSTVHAEGTGNQRLRLDTEDTDTESTGNHPTGGGWAQTTRQGERIVGHCQLYIQRAQTTSQTGGTHWGTLGQSTVHSEGTGNQSNRGHTGTDNCTYRGHRQPVRQGDHSRAHWVKYCFGH